MPRESLLGDMSNRAHTDLRLPQLLVDRIEEVCYALGIPKNAFFVLGAATLALKLLPLLPGRKRARLVADLEEFVVKLIANVKQAL